MTTLTDFAADRQHEYERITSPLDRKGRGHFGTPRNVAGYMAGLVKLDSGKPVRVLDAGAGVGTLSAAICDAVLLQSEPRHLVVELWENDPQLEPFLRQTMVRCCELLAKKKHTLDFSVKTGDFVVEHSTRDLFSQAIEPIYDYAIMNPPYFKVRKESESARIMSHIVHGQPNIYIFFMAVASDLLVDGGQLIAITPRSYFNGAYFKKFRKWFFDRMTIQHIHTFESRSEIFSEGDVLQESVILKAVKSTQRSDVLLSSTAGRQFQSIEQHTLPYTKVVEDQSGDHVIRVLAHEESQLISIIDRLPSRFRQLPFKISTGPVVTFRSTDYLRHEKASDTAPLLWMHNIRPFVTQYPPINGKPTHILISDLSKKLLLPSMRYVILKRFTSKEEKRRLVAGLFTKDDSYSSYIGLENHLNYVYRPNGELTQSEAYGLAAFFNSAIMDRYFRAISGNTQVNATEVRAMPVPDIKTIQNIGETIFHADLSYSDIVDEVVGKAIGLSAHQIQHFCRPDQ